ncbi:MAG: ABC transporter permease [Verrucomicrobiota bacterium]
MLPRAALLTLFFLVVVAPVGWALGYAVAYSVGWAGLLSRGFTLEHWHRVLTDGEVLPSMAHSLALAAVCVVLTVILALCITLPLRASVTRGALSDALLFPLALPPTVAALFVLQMFSGAGLLSRVAFHLGLIREPRDFPHLIFDPAGIGILTTHLLLAVPFFCLLFAQIHRNEKLDELTSLAKTLGAGRAACLRRVVLPILLRRSRANLSLFFIGVLGSFEIPSLLGAQSPRMISVLTRQKFALFDLSEKSQAYIIAVLYSLLALSLIALTFRKKEAPHVA